jgi:hypothetical protein
MIRKWERNSIKGTYSDDALPSSGTLDSELDKLVLGMLGVARVLLRYLDLQDWSVVEFMHK